MSFARTQADGVWLGAGYVPSAADWQDLSTKIFHSVNGKRGGAWAPSSAIVFPNGCFVTGPTVVAHGGELVVGSLQIADGTWPTFATGHALRSREIVQPMLSRQCTPREAWTVHEATASIQSLSLGIQPSDRSRVIKPATIRIELDVHDSATLKAVTFTFSVPAKRSAAPIAMPRFRVLRVDSAGTVETLASSLVADANGWESPPTVTSPATWFAAGLPQSFRYVCDQKNVIDVSAYSYWAEVVEEDVDPVPVLAPLLDGNTLREQKLDVDFASTQNVAALTGFQAVESGVTPSTGQRVLLKNQTNRYENGIWVVDTGGAWSRATDLDEVSDVTKAFFVYVKAGNVNKGSAWQIATPYPTAFSNVSSLGGTADITFERFVPSGNRYHSITLSFDTIAEMRWQ